MSENAIYITVQDACELVTVKETTLRKWLREGRIDGNHIGRKWLVNKDDLLRVAGGAK